MGPLPLSQEGPLSHELSSKKKLNSENKKKYDTAQFGQCVLLDRPPGSVEEWSTH